MSSLRDTSVRTKTARSAISRRISAAVRSPCSALISAMTTEAPSRTSPRAIPRPTPRPAPVMTATLPSSRPTWLPLLEKQRDVGHADYRLVEDDFAAGQFETVAGVSSQQVMPHAAQFRQLGMLV